MDVVDRLLRSRKLRTMTGDDETRTYESYRRTLQLAKLLGGYIPVSYREPEDGFGRFTSRVSIDDGRGHLPSLTTMKREVRSHLAARYYHDVDFVNCQPVILEQVLERHRIPCPQLSKYVGDREACLEDVMTTCGVTRNEAKSLFIRLVFLGSVSAWQTDVNARAPPPSWIDGLRSELLDNAERLVVRSELDDIRRSRCKDLGGAGNALRRPMATHALASVLSIYLQTLERRCLEALYDAIQRDGFEVGSLIYDGLLVRKPRDGDGEISKTTLKTWRAHVLCMAGYDIEIKVKPFDTDPSWLEPVDSDGHPSPDPHWDDSWMDGTTLMTYAQMKAKWEERSIKVTVCGDYMREEREKHAIYTRSKLVDAYEHLKYSQIKYNDHGEGTLTKHSFIKAWVTDEEIRTKKYIDFYPPPLMCPEHTYNMWSGFAISNYACPEGASVDVDSEGVRAFVEHIHILMNRDDKATNYLIDWIAQIFQQPSHKTGIALLLKGAEGVGKNRMTDLIKLMLGDGLFLETAKPSSVIFGRFTEARRGKFLIVINEANGADNHAASEELKDMITSATFIWEAKGRDGVQMRAYDRFIFTTNNENCLKINPDSRRYVVFEVSSELKGNTAYFKSLSRHIENEHARYEFYQFLMRRNIEHVDWINDRPLTRYYDNMVERNLPREYQFLRDVIIVPAYASNVDLLEKTGSELFVEFQGWLATSTTGGSTYSTTINKFGQRMTSLVSGNDSMPGITKPLRASYKAYAFDVDLVVRSMVDKKWIASDDLPLRQDAFVG